MLSKIKTKTLVAACAMTLGVTVGASWTSASSATPAPVAAATPQFVFMDTPIAIIDGTGGIRVRIDPPELSAVFPVLP